eukprot:2523457-Amphidinium_carterae.2
MLSAADDHGVADVRNIQLPDVHGLNSALLWVLGRNTSPNVDIPRDYGDGAVGAERLARAKAWSATMPSHLTKSSVLQAAWLLEEELDLDLQLWGWSAPTTF